MTPRPHRRATPGTSGSSSLGRRPDETRAGAAPDGSEAVSYRVGGPDVTWRAAGEEIVVLDLGRSVYFGLNPAAARLWRRLVAGATAAELVAALAGAGAVDPDRAAEDVDAFLRALRDQGLLRSR